MKIQNFSGVNSCVEHLVYGFRYYIEQGSLPKRFGAYHNDMRNYALVANGTVPYMQRTGDNASSRAFKDRYSSLKIAYVSFAFSFLADIIYR